MREKIIELCGGLFCLFVVVISAAMFSVAMVAVAQDALFNDVTILNYVRGFLT